MAKGDCHPSWGECLQTCEEGLDSITGTDTPTAKRNSYLSLKRCIFFDELSTSHWLYRLVSFYVIPMVSLKSRVLPATRSSVSWRKPVRNDHIMLYSQSLFSLYGVSLQFLMMRLLSLLTTRTTWHRPRTWDPRGSLPAYQESRVRQKALGEKQER